ncbi:helix-turn-helix domain-containing protein [Embleya sp. NPDC050493]|uniref:helix-turn-helix domain-containing protein n=1 Tax=Embleya sp. NPDC050493 TaxID=3363989 RepID=UPI00378A2E5F
MATDPFPSVRRRRLGAELRRLREAKDLTCQDVAEALDSHYSKISRVEMGKSSIRRPDLRAMLDLYGLDDEKRREALERLAAESRTRGWWQKYGDTIPPAYADFISMEAASAKIQSFALALVPGLLQVPEYSREIILAGLQVPSPVEVQQLVDVRVARQARLTEGEPVELQAIICESVLRQNIGGPAVMRKQLEYLLEASELPNVTLLVLGDGAGAHPGLHGSFVVLSFHEESDLDVVLVENLTSSLYFENREEIARYRWAFERNLAAANSPVHSAQMIQSAIRNLE